MWLTILIISRDLLIVLTVAVINLAIGRREFRPSIYGKIATATYILTCVTIMYFNYLQRTSAHRDGRRVSGLARVITLISGCLTTVVSNHQRKTHQTHGRAQPS